MDIIDWEILDYLSDDYESIAQIYPYLSKSQKITLHDIADRLIVLYQQQYIYLLDNEELNITEFRTEVYTQEYEYSNFWFGLAPKGVEFWEGNTIQYGGEPIDWSKSWITKINYNNNTGYLIGTTHEVCQEALEIISIEYEDIHINKSSLKTEPVAEFQAKYYKTLKNGYKLSFKFQRV